MVHATLSFIKQMKNFFFFLKFFFEILNAQGLIRAHRVDFFSKKISAHVLVLGRPEYLYTRFVTLLIYFTYLVHNKFIDRC